MIVHHLRTFVEASVRRNGYGIYSQWEAWSKLQRMEVDLTRDLDEQVLEWVHEQYPPRETHERSHVN